MPSLIPLGYYTLLTGWEGTVQVWERDMPQHDLKNVRSCR